ncbi:MAG: DJ-1/PfpI family protein [Verrucomicrobiae bacterium]|nr:DJ-1/PfpI family protein [Verrucomicrobiae bacterium]
MNFAFLAFHELEELDLIGPWEFLAGGLKKEGVIDDAFIVAEKAETITCAKGLQIVPHYSFETCPEFEYILIPGGWGTRAEATNPVLLNFLRDRTQRCKAVLSVCTGAFLLEEIGLLSGKRSTTHWGSLDRLRKFGGIAVREERYTHDGNLWCSAGVSAGMDMALAFIAHEFGEATAARIQFYTEYYPDEKIYGKPEKEEEAPGYLRKRTERGRH